MKNKNAPENRRNNDSLPMKEAMDQLLKTFNIKTKFDQTKLIAYWEEIMGKTIASRTEKLYIKDKVLYIHINSAPLKNELMMSKSKILEIINKGADDTIVNDVVVK